MTDFVDARLTVGVCDTQPVVLEGLRGILTRSGIYKMIEPARSLESLSSILVTMSPRVTVVDKAWGAAELTDWLKRMRTRTNTAIVIWGANFSDSEALRFLQSGARGVLRKTATPETILACLDAVCSGGTWMDDQLFQASAGGQRTHRTDLTAREQQVLELVEQGLRNKDIANELGIRPGTVKIHLKHIFEKSGVRGRYSLALSGIRTRYINEVAEDSSGVNGRALSA